MQPAVATIAPPIPAIRIPTKVAELIDTGPGVIPANGYQMGKFIYSQPVMGFYHLLTDQRNSSIPAANAEQPHLYKTDKQLKIYHHCRLLCFCRKASILHTPIRAAASTIKITFTSNTKAARKAAP